jgi:molecular chaperone HtpG
MSTQVQTYQFQAETKQLLDLMIHSLYTSKEIFLRELISNASDALDRLRFEALTNAALAEDAAPPEINLTADRERRTLTVSDNGIGMSRDEVVAHIGTIAKSGTRELRERARAGASGDKLAELIGQFGVGFYSSFMVAERVSLLTRRAGEETATLWESAGDGQYTIAEAAKPEPGTAITLHLLPADPESGIEDYTDKWVLSRIVKRHSDFISYPVAFRDAGAAAETDAGGDEAGREAAAGGQVLNSMKLLWTRPAAEVSEGEYGEFYKHISHDLTEPLHVITARAEGLLEYQALLFVPSHAPYDLYYHAAEKGLRLYAKGVLIMERCDELLPRYLRFMKGVVDSADLPLNISRQMLQQDRQVAQIRKWLTKKTLDALQSMMDGDADKYLKFWEQFGRAFKEGVSEDYENKDRLTPLLLFESSDAPDKLTTLKDYVGRMKEEQAEIFYLTGESREVVENSPHLEALREKNYEVLYLVDPVDELLLQHLTEFEGRKLKSAAKGTVTLGSEEERERAEQELKSKQEESAELLKAIQKHLDEYVKDVRLTVRLTASPVCLVGSEMDYSPQMERLLQMGKGGRPKQRRVMELNPRHEVFVKMQERFGREGDGESLGKYAELLLGYALLAEGSELPDPVKFNRLLVDLMAHTL